MSKYKLIVTYDGTRYVGWQVQPNGVSIQGLLEECLSTLLKEKIRVLGAGRTDAGTHALGQGAHFVTEKPLDHLQMLRSLNGMLPYDIRVIELKSVPDSFHAQYSALGKEYHYHLWLEPSLSPFLRLYRHHVPYQIDCELLQEAANLFVGTFDFATFANVGSTVKSTVRSIYRLDVVKQEGGVRLEFEGNGFLYKMVRNIVGTLLEVASGRRRIEEIKVLLDKKDRRAAGIAAPARGLFLMKVHYNLVKEEMCLNSLPTCCEREFTSA